MKNIITKAITLVTIGVLAPASVMAQRSESFLRQGWEFTKQVDSPNPTWERVTVPHDWAITGPFDRSNDLQIVRVEQNLETEETAKTGRTGGLPFIGKGAYRTTFEVADTAGKAFTLVFDGAMSNAVVRLNKKIVARWPYGYNSFFINIEAGDIFPGKNLLEVDLQNRDQQSRWYPGAGLYRNVRLLETNKVHIPVWGTYVTTPYVDAEEAAVKLQMEIDGVDTGKSVWVETAITDPAGATVATARQQYSSHGQPFTQSFLIAKPQLWSPEAPVRYRAVTRLVADDGSVLDTYTTPFGVRRLEYIPEKGFFLNGKSTKFKGVCNHHDLGPLGAAVNRSALAHQIALLKDMGANAIRTSHNMPDPQLVELCDSMGMMLMVEPFDDWGFRPKSPNGYGAVFNEWAERDVTNMVRQFRNNPSVMMWSIGNEVPSQGSPDGLKELEMLQNLVHSLDATRPVTCGMEKFDTVLENGFAAALDIPGFNYKPQFYEKAYEVLPQKLVLGSETASCVSSRGVYKFPLTWAEHNAHTWPDNQSSAYDNESCSWSNTPELDFDADNRWPWMIGQFVWTGFDYLGEPTPYDTDAWPAHSSYFGIIDLASLPKDRYYLYRSQWNTTDHTLHMLPHWTWPGREGETTPVMVYTDLPEAELFVNGKSQGRMKHDSDTSNRLNPRRWRLIWDNVVYEPGEITVKGYDAQGAMVAEQTIRTAGQPAAIRLSANRAELDHTVADGDLAYVTVTVVDKDGNSVPTASNRVSFKVEGDGSFRATANGDPNCLLPFQNPEMDLFSGAATAIVQAGTKPGVLKLKVTGKGLKPATISIPVK